jgi:polyisoprenyl-phosphate glycosyltransferase
VIEAKARVDKRYRLIKLSRNFGHQIAITVGLDHAAGRAVIVMDADLQDPPEVVLEMIAKWKEGYEVVSAERASRQGESRFKRATADLFYRLMGRLGEVSTPRNAGDFRLVDRRALDCFIAMPERDGFVRGMFAWIGFRQGSVTFDRPPRGKANIRCEKWSRWGRTESSRSPMPRFAWHVGRIYAEAKRRPLYIIERAMSFEDASLAARRPAATMN